MAPGADLAEAVRVALAGADAPRRVGPRIVLRSELALADTEIWEPAIVEVARRWKPFTVRLVKAEIVRDRMLGLVAGGPAVLELHAAIEEALARAGFPDRSGVSFLPMVIVGSTFDGLTVHELHGVAAAIREHFTFPIEFPASSVLCYSESADEYDLPVAAYPLLGQPRLTQPRGRTPRIAAASSGVATGRPCASQRATAASISSTFVGVPSPP